MCQKTHVPRVIFSEGAPHTCFRAKKKSKRTNKNKTGKCFVSSVFPFLGFPFFTVFPFVHHFIFRRGAPNVFFRFCLFPSTSTPIKQVMFRHTSHCRQHLFSVCCCFFSFRGGGGALESHGGVLGVKAFIGSKGLPRLKGSPLGNNNSKPTCPAKKWFLWKNKSGSDGIP